MERHETAQGQVFGPLAGGSDWFQWYHVEQGDTLSEIALWWFGNSSDCWWRRIWLANRRAVHDPEVIRLSQWLKIPYLGFSYHI